MQRMIRLASIMVFVGMIGTTWVSSGATLVPSPRTAPSTQPGRWGRDVVALVDGKPITRGDICDDGKRTHEYLRKYLTWKIERVIFDGVRDGFGVKVSDEEMTAFMKNAKIDPIDIRSDADRSTVMRAVESKKVDARIERQIADGEGDFARYLALEGSTKREDWKKMDAIVERYRFRVGATKVFAYKLAKRLDWWKERYKKAKVKVLDPKLQDAWIH
jgi:hypothetical protein